MGLGASGLILGADSPTDVLLNSGVLGAVVVILCGAAAVLFRYLTSTYKAQLDDKDRAFAELKDSYDVAIAEAGKRAEEGRARAERAEEELRKLNDAFRERYVTVLGDATRAVSEALDVMRAFRRSRYDE